MTDVVLSTVGWPIVVLVCPPQLDQEWVAQLDAKFRPLFLKKERFAVITDTTPVLAMPSAVVRKALASWAARPDQAELQKRFNVGSSTIIQNPVIRATLQALYWVWTPGSPQHVSRDLDEAWTWCVGQLESAKIALPAPAIELKRRVDADLRAARRPRSANVTD